jgi:hypothetical protein
MIDSKAYNKDIHKTEKSCLALHFHVNDRMVIQGSEKIPGSFVK